jgi:RNA polymerase sigma-70 factor (ECF subfamily)
MQIDADAIGRLYEAHAASMLAFFARRTFQPESSMDLLAETFAAAFADRAQFHGDSDAAALAWLYGIARHRLADFERRGRVERRALDRLGFQRRPLSDSEFERIEELAGHRELREHLASGLDELSANHRRALQLRVVEERPYPEVAQTLGVSQQTARAWVSRGLSAMRQSPAFAHLSDHREH